MEKSQTFFVSSFRCEGFTALLNNFGFFFKQNKPLEIVILGVKK